MAESGWDRDDQEMTNHLVSGWLYLFQGCIYFCNLKNEGEGSKVDPNLFQIPVSEGRGKFGRVIK